MKKKQSVDDVIAARAVKRGACIEDIADKMQMLGGRAGATNAAGTPAAQQGQASPPPQAPAMDSFDDGLVPF